MFLRLINKETYIKQQAPRNFLSLLLSSNQSNVSSVHHITYHIMLSHLFFIRRCLLEPLLTLQSVSHLHNLSSSSHLLTYLLYLFLGFDINSSPTFPLFLCVNHFRQNNIFLLTGSLFPSANSEVLNHKGQVMLQVATHLTWLKEWAEEVRVWILVSIWVHTDACVSFIVQSPDG